MKNKKGFGKTWHFFYLKLAIFLFGICQMVLWLIGLLLDHFDPQKKLKCWKYVEIKWIFIIKIEYAKYSICSFFFTYYTARAPISSMNLFLWNTLLKFLEKRERQIKLFHIPLAVYKRILNIYEIPCIHLW